jgi:peroxiredoxin family protein
MDVAYETDLEQRIASLESKLGTLLGLEVKVETLLENESKQKNKIIIQVITHDMDKVFVALLLSATAASMGTTVQLFFQLWGLDAIRKTKNFAKKSMTEKTMSLLSPFSNKSLPLSKLNLLGIGPAMMKLMLKEHSVPSVGELMNICREAGVEFTACENSMALLGITQDELLDFVVRGSLTQVVKDATVSKANYIIG